MGFEGERNNNPKKTDKIRQTKPPTPCGFPTLDDTSGSKPQLCFSLLAAESPCLSCEAMQVHYLVYNEIIKMRLKR